MALRDDETRLNHCVPETVALQKLPTRLLDRIVQKFETPKPMGFDENFARCI